MNTENSESTTKQFRTDRFFHVHGEGWYFRMRGETSSGPYADKLMAKIVLKRTCFAPAPDRQLYK